MKDSKFSFNVSKLPDSSNFHFTPIELALVFLIDQVRSSDRSSAWSNIIKSVSQLKKVGISLDFFRKIYNLIHSQDESQLFNFEDSIVLDHSKKSNFDDYINLYLDQSYNYPDLVKNTKFTFELGRYILSKCKNHIINQFDPDAIDCSKAGNDFFAQLL